MVLRPRQLDWHTRKLFNITMPVLADCVGIHIYISIPYCGQDSGSRHGQRQRCQHLLPAQRPPRNFKRHQCSSAKSRHHLQSSLVRLVTGAHKTCAAHVLGCCICWLPIIKCQRFYHSVLEFLLPTIAELNPSAELYLDSLPSAV